MCVCVREREREMKVEEGNIEKVWPGRPRGSPFHPLFQGDKVAPESPGLPGWP